MPGPADAEASTSALSSSDPSSSSAAGGGGELSPSIIDMDIFGQLLEMDEEDDREFSREIVWNYFDQAKSTFKSMQEALESEDLLELSTLGHFLKGSSAACGVIKVRDSCEYMQHYGKQRDDKGVSELSREDALKRLAETLRAVKVQYKEAEKALRVFYDDMEGFEQDELADEPAPPAEAKSGAAAASAPAADAKEANGAAHDSPAKAPAPASGAAAGAAKTEAAPEKAAPATSAA